MWCSTVDRRWEIGGPGEDGGSSVVQSYRKRTFRCHPTRSCFSFINASPLRGNFWTAFILSNGRMLRENVVLCLLQYFTLLTDTPAAWRQCTTRKRPFLYFFSKKPWICLQWTVIRIVCFLLITWSYVRFGMSWSDIRVFFVEIWYSIVMVLTVRRNLHYRFSAFFFNLFIIFFLFFFWRLAVICTALLQKSRTRMMDPDSNSWCVVLLKK